MLNVKKSFALVCAMLIFSSLASAQPLTDRLPASTLIYLGWSPNASLQTTATAKMLADERFMGPWKRLIQEIGLQMPDGLDGGERISEHFGPMLVEAAQCEGCLALLELKQGKRHFNPQSVLMIDLGARRKSFEEHFKPIHSRMKERIGERLQMIKLDKSWVWYKPDRKGKPAVTWGFVGDTFIIYFGDGAEDLVTRLVKGELKETLKTAPAFVDSVSKIPGESVFTTYLDTKVALNIIKRLIEKEGGQDFQLLVGNWDKVLAEFGLDNVKGVAEKTTIEDRQFVTRTLVRTEGAPKGLLGLVASQAVDDAMMKTIPADAMAAAAFRLDLSKFYDQLKESVIRIMGNDAREGFKDLEQGAEQMGLPIQNVLAPLGDQWVIYNAASQGGFALTGWTMVVQIKDVEKFKKTIGTVRAMLAKTFAEDGAQVRQLAVDGETVEYLNLGGWNIVAPAWSLVGDKFVIALYPQIVEDAIKHIKDGGKSILDNPDYAAARKRTGNDGPMVYVNGPEVTKNLYPLGLLFINFINSFNGFDDGDRAPQAGADLLPSLQRLLSYVGHDTLAIKVTPDGILKTRSVTNPLLSPLAWVDSPVVWLALGIPSLGQAEIASDRVRSASNLRQIGQGLQMWATEQKGKYPENFQELIKAQQVTQEALKSPFGPAKEGKDYVYLYFAGMNTNIGAEVMVAYDQAALENDEGTNVLYGDGHVDWLPADQFKKALEESKKKNALNNANP